MKRVPGTRYLSWKAHRMARLQIDHFYRTACRQGRPAWYETQRKTTHVVFWG